MVPRPNSYSSDESTDARRICRDNPDPIPQQALVPFRVVVDAPPTAPVLPLHSVILLDTGYEVLHHIYEYRRYVRQTVPDIILIGFVRARSAPLGGGVAADYYGDAVCLPYCTLISIKSGRSVWSWSVNLDPIGERK